MDSYQRLQIKRVRNGYIVGPVEPHFDHHLPNAHAINVFQDFDDLTAHLEMLLGVVPKKLIGDTAYGDALGRSSNRAGGTGRG